MSEIGEVNLTFDKPAGSKELPDSKTYLRQIVEAGIDKKGLKIVVYPDTKTALGGASYDDNEVVAKNLDQLYQKLGKKSSIETKTGKLIDVDAFVDISEMYQNTYGDNQKVELVEKGGDIFVVAEFQINGLKITEIYDPDYPVSKAYKDWANLKSIYNKALEERDRWLEQNKIDDESLYIVPMPTKPSDMAPEMKDRDLPVTKLVVSDINNANSVNLADLLPSEFRLNKILRITPGFNEDLKSKNINYSMITDIAHVGAVLHEWGHLVFSVNDDPAKQEIAEKMLMSSMQVNAKLQGSPQEIDILTENERGASDIMLEILKIWDEKGFQVRGLFDKSMDMAISALCTYQSVLGSGEKKSFVRGLTQEEVENRLKELRASFKTLK